MAYDALNRVVEMIYPEGAEGHRRRIRPRYNRAGSLDKLFLINPGNLEQEEYVRRITYNAKGQRTLIAYGNRHMTRYAYDEHTFRLKRLRTEKCRTEDEHVFQPNGGVLQDFAYAYDMAGNILSITHREPNCGVGGKDTLARNFQYDPLYRLISATGREQDKPIISDPAKPWLEHATSFQYHPKTQKIPGATPVNIHMTKPGTWKYSGTKPKPREMVAALQRNCKPIQKITDWMWLAVAA